jgi:hypothetical protein
MNGYNILARLKAADMGRYEPGREPTRLMHIACSAEQKTAVQRFLEAMYNSNHLKQFPLGIKMRFICDMLKAVGM